MSPICRNPQEARLLSCVAPLLVVLCALGIATPPAGATAFGLSDQHADTFADPRVAGANWQLARLIVPWDVALADPARVSQWLSAVTALRMTPLVSFERAPDGHCPGKTCTLPSTAEYRDAFAAFRARWPQVREFTAWNEPNHPDQPTADRPERAAAYFDTLRSACPACTIAAGDLVDSASMKGYFTEYAAALTAPVQVWAIHNYGDLTYDRPSYVSWLAARTDQPLWLTETGGLVALTSSATGTPILAYDEGRAAASIRRLLDLLASTPTIERAYVYHWKAQAGAPFDAGLLGPDGTPRPAYAPLRAAVGTRPPAPAARPTPSHPGAPDPAGSVPDAAAIDQRSQGAGFAAPVGGVVPATVGDAAAGSGARLGTLRRTRSGWSVALRCPADARQGCRGRVTLARPGNAAGRPTVLGSASFDRRSDRWRRLQITRRPGITRAKAGRIDGTILLHGAGLATRSWPTADLAR